MNRAARIARTLGWVALGLLMLATGTVRADSSEPTEYLDEETAATITVVAQPLVFAYAHRELAANARDYATVAAAAVNEAGKIHYVLILYFWSTVDPRLRTDAPPAAEPLALQADDRSISLSLRGHSAHEAGIGIPVHAPPGNPVIPNVYSTDLPTLRYLVAAHRLSLRTDSGGAPQAYELWEDRRAALRAFVQYMGGG